MRKDEQIEIEEMAEALGSTWVVDLEGNPHDLSDVLMRCDIEQISEQLFSIGYRKAFEVALEVLDEIEKIAMSKIDADISVSDLDDTYYIEAIDELRTKYAEGTNDKVQP